MEDVSLSAPAGVAPGGEAIIDLRTHSGPRSVSPLVISGPAASSTEGDAKVAGERPVILAPNTGALVLELRAITVAEAAQLAPRGGATYLAIKRTMDIVFSLVLLVLSAPVIALLAIIIRLDSPGPAIFRQQRLGAVGRPFTFYKFRTMCVDARSRYPHLYDYQYSPDARPTLYFKLAEDPRVSRFGRILRRTSLDELPNLWNVFRGDMSLVGPRPEIPEMLCNYDADQLAKFSVKPGLTGMAQVGGRNILSFQETVRKDLEYIRTQSLKTDLRILVMTPVVVMKMFGAL
jgi:lipopolysaccharide/colanic/teichoic acid biosynthesis glycosyltransferase